MDKNILIEIKKRQLEIMDNIHSLCIKNDVSYYMVGGTLIGALRHKGFIPWDVDIDIAMPRSDYEKFKNVCSTQLDSKYMYRDYKNTKGFNKPHSIVQLKNSHLHINGDNSNKYDFGVFVDVFPLDNVPNDQSYRKKQKNKIDRLKRLLIIKTSYWKPKNIFKRVVKAIVKVCLIPISLNYIQRKLEEQFIRFNKEKSIMMANFAGKYSYEKESHSNGVFGKPTPLPFEGRLFWGPEKADEYLKKVYGDYMKLPSKEEQENMLHYYDSFVIE